MEAGREGMAEQVEGGGRRFMDLLCLVDLLCFAGLCFMDLCFVVTEGSYNYGAGGKRDIAE